MTEPGTDVERRVEHAPPAVIEDAMSIEQLLAEGKLIEDVMREVMTEGEHYGVIPGTKGKPTLLKPGAEKLNRTFKLAPTYPADRMLERWDGDHLTVRAVCVLIHRPTGAVVAEGIGLCSSREEKYAYRGSAWRCPDCGAEAIVKSSKKRAYFCIRDKGGCGNRFAFDTDKANEIDRQDVGKKENDRLPDTWNTIEKMACKRALVAATLNGTAASDVFTQDVDDSDEASGHAAPEEPGAAAASPPGASGEEAASGGLADAAGADLLMTFGQHKGTRVGDLPIDYLRWLADVVSSDDELDGRERFVPEDEYGGKLKDAAFDVVGRMERRQAIENFSSVFKNLLDHGSLPPGHESWEAYLKWYIEGRYKIDPAKWRSDLSTLQIREMTAYLMDMEIPL